METSVFDQNFTSAYIPHEVFYITPAPIALSDPYYRLNRAGFTSETPINFFIKRTGLYGLNLIHCITKGCGSVTLRGKKYRIKAGMLFILPANEAHCYESDATDPMGLLWFEYQGANSNALTQSVVDQQGPVISGNIYQEISLQCALLLSSPHPTLQEETQILYHILVTIGLQANDAASYRNKKDLAILEYIDAHLGEKLTLMQVGTYFGYHPNYLSTRFTKIAGMTFLQYILYRRLRQACYLLVTTDKPIEQISSDLGFYDVSHFIQRFKAAEGVTPLRYRKESSGLVHAFQTE